MVLLLARNTIFFLIFQTKKRATEDIADLDAIRTIVKDIFEVRLKKLQFSIKPVLESKESHARINNLTSIELKSMKGFICKFLSLRDSISI